MSVNRNNIINKIKPAGSTGAEYTIAPTLMVDTTTNYSASLPTLTEDSEIQLRETWILRTLTLDVTETLTANQLAIINDDPLHVSIWLYNVSQCLRFFGQTNTTAYFTTNRRQKSDYYYCMECDRTTGVCTLLRTFDYLTGSLAASGTIPATAAIRTLLPNFTACITQIFLKSSVYNVAFNFLKQETISDVVHSFFQTDPFDKGDGTMIYLYADINTSTGEYIVTEINAETPQVLRFI